MNLLDFANPSGWWWAALALPIIALYILKVRLRRQRVSTFMFWDRVFDEKKPRAWWQQLRHWLSLLLQLALLLLLVGALVDPLWSWQKNQRRKIVLVIDNSASMGANVSAGQTRLAEAKRTAAALVRSLRTGDEMAILSAGGKPQVVLGLTNHVRSLLESLDSIQLTDAPTALTEAVTTAKRLLPTDDSQSHITVLTDGCDPSTESLLTDKMLEVIGVGSKINNVAITQFQARRSLLDAIGYQVLVEVTNLSDEAKKVELELKLEDQLVDVVPFNLEAGAKKTLNLDQASSTGGRLVAVLGSNDGFEVDNRAMAILPERRKMPITVVTPGSLFLKSVLESIPLVDLTIGSALPESLTPSSRNLIVLHKTIPNPLPPGKLFIINPTTECGLWTVGEKLEQPIVAKVKESSPVTQHVKLTNVIFPEALALNFSVEHEPLIQSPLDEPLLTHIRRPNGDVLILNVDLDQGDLPLRIAFPVLMKNAIEWFAGVEAELRPAASTGQSVTVDVSRIQTPIAKATSTSDPASAEPAKDAPAANGESNSGDAKSGASELTVVKASESDRQEGSLWVRNPAGELLPLAREGEQATLAMLDHTGLWTIGSKEDLAIDPWNPTATGSLKSDSKSSPNGTTDTKPATTESSSESKSSEPAQRAALEDRLVRISSNLCNADESDLKPRVELRSPNDLGLIALGGWSIWFYLAAMALLLAAIEWWLYQRRVVG